MCSETSALAVVHGRSSGEIGSKIVQGRSSGEIGSEIGSKIGSEIGSKIVQGRSFGVGIADDKN